MKISYFRKFITEFLFWMHAVIMAVLVLLFFIPQSLWSGKIFFHLCYISAVVASEIIMGLILSPVMGKFRIVCPLTTVMQQMRGVSYKSPDNYNHSFVREFARRFNIKIPYGFVGALIFLSLAIVLWQNLIHFSK